MRNLKYGLFAAACAVVTSAFGAAGTLQFVPDPPVKALSNPVTYSIPATTSPARPALETYFGFSVGAVSNAGTNTINDVRIAFTAKVTDAAELITLFKPELYLPSNCTWPKDAQGNPVPANPLSFTCTVTQIKSGGTVPSFLVFFKAPTQVDNNGQADTAGTDFISTTVRVDYAEGTNDLPSGGQNSVIQSDQANLISLGTSNPVDIKSALPKTGGKFYTGAAGIPSGGNPLTELAAAPPLSGSAAYATASIVVSSVPDSSLADAQCGNLGHFKQCPVYETKILNPDLTTTTFPTAPFLALTYRIDASNLKMSPAKILNSVVLTYTSNGGVTSNVQVCTNSTISGTGVPCILSAQCYKRSTPGWTPDLDGDCEWILINSENGTLKIL